MAIFQYLSVFADCSLDSPSLVIRILSILRIIGVSDTSSTSIGWILSPMMWFSHVRDNRSCQILSVNSACPLVICAAPTLVNHSRALQACTRGPPKDWRRRTGRPRQTWLRTVEDDLRPLNFGLAMARRRTMDRPAWRLLVDAATSS